jgi:Tol biopolymer transport system component
VNSAVWLAEELVVYGEELLNEEREVTGYNIWLSHTDGADVQKLYEFELDKSESMIINDSSKDGKRLLLSKTKAFEFPRIEGNLMIFDIETKSFNTILYPDYTRIPRFSPAEDLVLYDIGQGYKTPGGPIEIIAADGTFRETLHTGQAESGDDPTSYVLSPDGKYIVTIVEKWGSGNKTLVITELIHPMPEFGTLPVLVISIILTVTVGASLLRKWKHLF